MVALISFKAAEVTVSGVVYNAAAYQSRWLYVQLFGIWRVKKHFVKID